MDVIFALAFSCKKKRAASSPSHASSCNLPPVTDASETVCQGQGADLWKNPSAWTILGTSEPQDDPGFSYQRTEAELLASMHTVNQAGPPRPSHLRGLCENISGQLVG